MHSRRRRAKIAADPIHAMPCPDRWADTGMSYRFGQTMGGHLTNIGHLQQRALNILEMSVSNLNFAAIPIQADLL